MPQIPVTHDELEALVVKESDTVCDALKKLYKLSIAVWKLNKFKYTESRTLSADYRTMLCAAECPAPDESGSPTSSNPPT